METGLETAVIGMACRVPGASDVDEFWNNLKNGVEAITFFSDDEVREDGIDENEIKAANFVKTNGGLLENREYFDAYFFGYTPYEARVMNPQMRIFHECAWEALENAGYDPFSYDGLIGVYAGAVSSYTWKQKLFSDNGKGKLGDIVLCDSSIMALHVSYKLNLTGPSLTLQTACSSSLVAVDAACRALLTGECNMALAGGTALFFWDHKGYMYKEGIINSTDGHCRAFDAKATGTIDGEGVGVVVLKLLEDAAADGDHIHAVIKGFASNSDGSRRVSFTAPSIKGQTEVIKTALQMAEFEPESIGYVETHGTGTHLGDPIEFEALTAAFNTDKKGYCGIGSVKTNIGHLAAASGIIGFIKTVMALKYRLIPPSLNFNSPNPRIDLKSSPFYVNTVLKKWVKGEYPLRAGVSSFGFGGTNAHVVLEEAPVIGHSSLVTGEKRKERDYQLILLSAKTPTALDKMTVNLVEYLKKNPGINLADTAYTLQVGRAAFPHRKMTVCSDMKELTAALSKTNRDKVSTFVSKTEKPSIIFMFPGQGAQYVNMGADLYCNEPVFREEMGRCFEILMGLMDNDIREILYPSSLVNRSNRSHMSYISKIDQTEIAQPLLFVFEYALARLLMEWGIEPHAMIGHSIGEYTAACLSGVFSLEDALKLVVLRGKLMQQMPAGSMLSVPMPQEQLTPLVDADGELSLAAVNTTSHCVVSGSHQAVEAFKKQLEEKGCECRLIHTSHAFHSAMMDPILKEFAEKVREIPLSSPAIPYISNVTGEWITDEQASDPQYWGTHLRKTVRFAHGLTQLFTSMETNAIFVEVGPGRALTTFVRQHKDKKSGQLALDIIRHPKENLDDIHYLLSKVGKLWLYGKRINWRGFHGEERRLRILLPGYPFEKQRYWIESDVAARSGDQSLLEPQPGKKRDLADWFYIPSWKRTVIPEPTPRGKRETSNWLLFSDDHCDIGRQLSHRLKQEDHDVIIVKPGPAFIEKEGDEYTINPGKEEDYDALLGVCLAAGSVPTRIVHLWNGQGEPGDRVQELGFYSLINIARAIGKQDLKDEIEITVVTDRMQGVIGDDLFYVQKATVIGAVHTISREYPNIRCRSIDIEPPRPGNGGEDRIIDQLVGEILSRSIDTLIAYRGNYRWLRSFEARRFEKPVHKMRRLKEWGVYLVTGGLGGIGLVLAEFLAKAVKARLILVGRSPFPGKKEWEKWLLANGLENSTALKIHKLQEMEKAGAEVLVFSADVTNKERMQEVIAASEKRFGKINGVIHAAGIPDGGIIQVRTPGMSQQVFGPKITGTLVLDSIFKDVGLDFFILCSSLASEVVLGGQVAYCAANVFLDHFAQYKFEKDNTFTVSINWDAWQQVGMAAKAAKSSASPGKIPGSRELKVERHPLFDKCEIYDPDQVVFISHLSIGKHWVLDEHRVMGKAVLPGTAYLELAAAAYERHTKKQVFELGEIFLLAPLILDDDEEKEIRTILKKHEDAYTYSFSVISRLTPGEDRWVEIAEGKIVDLDTRQKEPRKYEIEKILKTCNEEEMFFKPGEPNTEPKADMLTVGPRWNNLSRVNLGVNEGASFMELPANFTDDIKWYKVHPALLDIAATLLRQMVRGESSYSPFFYRRVRIKGNLPGKIFCHAVSAEDNKYKGEFLSFNIIMTNEQGIELVEIENYMLKRIDIEARGVRELSRQFSGGPSSLRGWDSFSQVLSSNKQEFPLKDGILPAEGIEVFSRILGGPQIPQVLVSTTDLSVRIKQADIISRKVFEGELPGGYSSMSKQARPELSSPYTAPQTDTEQKLAEIWQQFLGIDAVGVYDDFFELGGDSLKAITIGGRIHQALNVEIPLSEFFKNPTVKMLSQYIDKTHKSEFHSIGFVEKREYYPLSSAQKKMYFQQTMNPQNTAYNLTVAYIFTGDMKVENLDRIFNRMIERHESFKTSFHLIDETPVQKINPPAESAVKFCEVECRGDSASLHQSQVSTIEKFIEPFDLTKSPLLRVGVIKTRQDEHILVLDMHHIISDGVSFDILVKEFGELYNGKELPQTKIHYKEFTRWQLNLVQSGELKEQEEYWQKEFAGEIPALTLPIDYPRPELQSFAGNTISFTLGEEVTRLLGEIARKENTTLYVVLLALFKVLLAQISGQEETVVGTPTAGRRHADLQHIIGMFLCTLAIKSYPSKEKTFVGFLREVKHAVLKAFDNQDYPFEELVARVVTRRDLSRNPLFDVMFIFRNMNSPNIEISGLKARRYEYENKTSMVDITLIGVEVEKKLLFTFEYCTALFKEETMAKMVEIFSNIINIVTENIHIKIKNIQVVDYNINIQKNVFKDVAFNV